MSDQNQNNGKRFPRPYTNVINFNAVCRCCGGNILAGELVHKYIFGSSKPVFTHVPENCTNRNSKWIARDEWWDRTQKVMNAAQAGTTFPVLTPIGRYKLPDKIYRFKLESHSDQFMDAPAAPPQQEQSPVAEQQETVKQEPVKANVTSEYLSDAELAEALQIETS